MFMTGRDTKLHDFSTKDSKGKRNQITNHHYAFVLIIYFNYSQNDGNDKIFISPNCFTVICLRCTSISNFIDNRINAYSSHIFRDHLIDFCLDFFFSRHFMS